MIKLGNLSRWVALPKGHTVTLPGEDVRQVRLTVNSPGVAPLYFVNEDGELQFLAAPNRLEDVEFFHEGEVRITTDVDDVYFLAAENEPTHVVVEDPEIFTEISSRPARNPELEKMMYLQQVNTERRLAQMFAGMEERIADAFDAGQRAGTGRSAGENPADDGGTPPEPAAKPGQPASGAGKGEPASGTGGQGD